MWHLPVTKAGEEGKGASSMILSALRFLHDDGKWGEWLPMKAPDRAAVDRAMSKLCDDRTLAGFERRDVDQAEFDRLAKATKYVVQLPGAAVSTGGQSCRK
jgi:hypothetical protein